MRACEAPGRQVDADLPVSHHFMTQPPGKKTQWSLLLGKWLWLPASLLEAHISGCNRHVMHASFTQTWLYYQ